MRTVIPFGQIDLSNPEEVYEASVTVGEQEIVLDLNFEGAEISQGLADRIEGFVAQLPAIARRNQEALRADLKSGDTVIDYLNHHRKLLEELSGEKTTGPLQGETFLPALHLVRVGIYPENEDCFAVFDYTLGQELTDYLVVLLVREDGTLNYMTMES